jgi:hypothetical protein
VHPLPRPALDGGEDKYLLYGSPQVQLLLPAQLNAASLREALPKPLNQLLTHQADPDAKELRKHIRAYNSSFQMASSSVDHQGGVLPYWGVGVHMMRMQVSTPHNYLCSIVFCPTRTTTLYACKVVGPRV